MYGGQCRPTATVEGIAYYRIPHAPAAEDYRTDQRCHDCLVHSGGIHHAGCDMELCPRCAGQAIGCGCRWEGDEADEPESPNARRVAL